MDRIGIYLSDRNLVNISVTRNGKTRLVDLGYQTLEQMKRRIKLLRFITGKDVYKCNDLENTYQLGDAKLILVIK